MVDRDPRLRAVDEVRRQRTREIVTDILTHGLLPASLQREQGTKPLISITDNVSHICGALVVPSEQDVEIERGKGLYTATLKLNDITYKKFISADTQVTATERLLTSALYTDNASNLSTVFPVLAERRGEKENPTRKVFEERVNNSVLVVIPLSKIKPEDYSTKEAYSEILLNPVMPHTILMPEAFQEDLACVTDKSTDKVHIKMVGSLRKQIRGFNGSITFPDYEGALREILKEIREPLFIHGVRLPTREDIEKGR